MTVERKASEWDEGWKIAKESLQPPTYDKGDLRRMLMVLGALLEAGEASLVQTAARTGLDKKTVSDLIVKAQEQGAVIVSKVAAKYSIQELGPVFKASGCKKALTGALNALQ